MKSPRFILRHVPLAFPFALVSLVASACQTDAPESADERGTGAGGKADDLGGSNEPALSSLACWDGTFAYNTLTVKRFADRTEVRLAGAQMDIAEHLQADGAFPWQPATVTFSLPSEECQVSATDERLFNCVGQRDVTVTPQFDGAAATASMFVSVRTSHVVRTLANGAVNKAIELDVTTDTEVDSGKFTFRFGDQEGAFPQLGCSTDPDATVP